ncbi:CCAAT-binding factor [Actinidia rufa]|uniref:CCAAT-binding factor n=1 Tax=Actinidia rufa TaxID=165716 RepID=A0A7J0F711_9ERIC|nr:CCAAT-binding factor [Actinidia rufa]
MDSILSKKKNKKREKYRLSDLKTLGMELLSSRAKINNLPLLLTFVSPTSRPQYALEALLSLQAFFTPLLPQLPPSSSSTNTNGTAQDDPDSIYCIWLRSKFDELVNSLIDVSVSPQSEEGSCFGYHNGVCEGGERGGRFHSAIYHRLLRSIVHSTLGIDVLLDFLAAKYFKYLDIRVELSIHKIYYILSHIPSLESMDEKADYEMWNGLGVFIKDGDRKKHSELQKAEDKQRKIDKSSNNVLVTLHQAVIPRFSNPILLCDFLTRSYDIGGVISVMALSSLYILMTQHGLEYPNFYEKLYALLVPSIFMAKHRGKFFELLDSCLKSPLLPAYLAAAFTKKLSRLSLSVPPSGGLVIIVLIHNLLRRHPSINCLVHREDGGGISGEHSREGKDGESEDSCTSTEMSSKERGIDHFNNEEISPVKTNAMRSSLWEIDTVRHHYCPPVSRFVFVARE